MRNRAPTKKLNRRARDMLLAASLVFLVGALLIMLGIGLHIVNLAVPSNPGASAYDLARKAILSLGIGLAAASFLMALRAISWRTDHIPARRLGVALSRHLDDSFVFLRNISQRRLGYIDAVLISRHGVLLLRVTDRRGRFFTEGSQWLTQRRGKWQPMRWNPTRETEAQQSRLRDFLAERGIEGAAVDAAIIFMGEAPQVQLSVREPDLPVLHASQLYARLKRVYLTETRQTAATVQQIVDALFH